LVAALVEETMELTATASVQDVRAPEEFPFNRCAKQGGIESPWEWNMVLRHALDICVDAWLGRGFGIELPVVGRVTYVVWADNVYFIGHTPQDVQTMAQEFTDVIVSFKLRWKPESLQLLTTDKRGHSPVRLCQNGSVLEVGIVDELEVLGSIISNTGSSMPAVRHRLAKATACFWKYHAGLCARELGLAVRFKEFSKRVQATALYAASAWTWSRSLYNELYRWENALLRRIARVRRKPEENFVKHVERATRTARKLFHGNDNLSTATRVLDALHRIAGASFATLCLCSSWEASGDLDNYDDLVDTVCTPMVTVQVPSQCFLPACILWWDGQAWRFEQALGVVVDQTQSTTQWRHARTGGHYG
jgi:hypothetical protein